MSSSEPDAGALGGASPAARVLSRALDKVIKHSSWRKHSALVAASKSALDLLSAAAAASGPEPLPSPVPGIPAPAADAALGALLLALDPASPKVAEPALECVASLLTLRLLLGDIEPADPSASSPTSSPVSKLFAAVLSCGALSGDDALELAVLRVLVAFARCPTVSVSGECLGQVVKACYNVYLGSASGGNQLCAKLAIAQVLAIVFARVEANAMDVRVRTVSAADMMDLFDRSLNDSSVVQAAQAFINEAMEGSDVPEESPSVGAPIEVGSDREDGGLSKIREDGLALFKNLCKLSMKFATPDNPEDMLLLRGKVLSLELLRMVVDNAGPFWKMNEKYLEAVKQYLCLSLLKNSALSAMSVFQLLCSIFMSLLSRFRSGLKEEIGMFFPMLILRILENVLQPSFMQKMTVLNFLEKICKEPQVIIDIFVNYDCDVDAPNIFERIVNGLLKTALGVPAGSTTTLTVAQDQTFRIESVKCLATIIMSMSAWMDQQLRIGEFSPKSSEIQSSTDNHNVHNGEEGSGIDYEQQTDASSSDITDSSSVEQRRAYKIELQRGIALFNKKPSKGIDFLIRSKKIGHSPEDVASFLRNTSGLNATMIGDYLGERDDFPLKVMHAYVDTLNFKGMDFGQAIRYFLQGFSADTAYVLAYSVILLNTDAHNPMVTNKMSKADFMRNNRGIDNGKDLAEDYLSMLYDQIVNNEIKMSADSSVAKTKQTNGVSKLLGLDNIINFVSWRSSEDKAVGTNDLLIKHIQERFKAKRGKLESMFYTVADATILRFMMESCWAPMMAAFSVLLDQHGMMKLVYDYEQAIISIAIEDGNYLQEAWEHVLTCLSRFEHLHLLGEGIPTDASFLTVPPIEAEEKTQKSLLLSYLPRKTNALQNPAVMAAVRGGSYDSTIVKTSASALKSKAPEVRELIVRCVSQMVLSRVNNIKSGWKGVFMVFTSAAADDMKSTVLLAFETVEKIVRDYFHHITETETTTFTDCVTCLIAFTSSQFSSDANLNAIAFLRFCAVKLAEEGFVCRDSSTEQLRNSDMSDGKTTLHTDDHVSLWVPLLAGLAKLTADPRLTIKKGAVGVLFDILKDHGHMFSQAFWTDIFERVVYPLFSSEKSIPNDEISTSAVAEYNLPDLETQTLAVKCLRLSNIQIMKFMAMMKRKLNMETTSYAIVKLKNHMALLLLIVIQNIVKLYEGHRRYLSPEHISILLEMVSAIAAHSSEMSSESSLQMKFHKACSILEVSEPAIVHFENESYQSYLKFLQDLQHDYPSLSEKMNIESQIIHACERILRLYLKCAGQEPSDEASRRNLSFHCTVPLSTAKKEELAARTSLVLQDTCREGSKMSRYIKSKYWSINEVNSPQRHPLVSLKFDQKCCSVEIVEHGLGSRAVAVGAELLHSQEKQLKIESVKCLATIIMSMSAWMDQQLRIGEFSPKSSEIQSSTDNHNVHNGEEGSGIDYEQQTDASSSDITDSSSVEQRRAYKIELQRGIALFNKKPSKGIDFLIRSKKIGHSPEDVASFLRNTSGLNATMIGDYLGERDDFPLKVMHAYVDTLNFKGMDFGQAIRYFLQGFSADTAYVLAYSVILLNTDAHNPMVTNKMSKADFMRNNRGIDNGKDLAEDYLSMLYDQIVNNEIKMSADSSVAKTKQTNGKSKAPEVRELIVRCVSQMVLSRVNNIKSGWKGVFMVFTSAAADDMKSTVLLAFETVEKIEGFVCRDSSTEQLRNSDMSDGKTTLHTDDHVSLWVPLLAGLAKLTADPRLTIKKGAVGVLFDILKDHGHMFSQAFWTDIFERVVYPLFSSEKSIPNDEISTSAVAEYNLPDLETQTLAVKCLVGLFINYFDVIRPEFARTAAVVTYFVRSPYKHCATTGVSAIIRLTEGVGNKLSMEEWKEILVSFKESVMHIFVGFSKIARMMQDIEVPDRFESYSEAEQYSDHEVYGNDEEEANMETTSYAIVKLKNHMALLLIVIQNIVKLYEGHRRYLSPEHISILLEMVSAIAAHSSEMSSESSLQMKFHKACSILEVSEPAIVHFENESYQSYLKFLQDLQHDYPSLSEKMNIESQIIHACEREYYGYI
ncbi:hypothetical protein PR202_gb27929 [Eleusine coracana subsp. coracana]|uniref:SEC7 domain-containing protein n=1 Tax=Eleusine coracana subsp. coracana TaxID=191504 RepID=A0AAV5FXF0_ELECO|nr:hypothetical protein PR202_gb27929 [Eleusine coracana subsp. coracana]